MLEAKDYRHLRAWSMMLDNKEYLQQQLDAAVKDQAPIDAIYYDNDRWHTFSEISDIRIISHINRVLDGTVKHYFEPLANDGNLFSQGIQSVYSHNTVPFGPLVYGIVYGLKPKIIIETGTNNAYITAWIAKACIELGSTFYTIDLYKETDDYYESMNRNLYKKAKVNLANCGVLRGVTKIVNCDAIEFLLAAEIVGLLNGLGFAIIDDLHEEEHVYKELQILWRNLLPGGMVALHDVVDVPGINNAVSRFIKETHDVSNRLWFFISSGYAVLQKDK